MAKGIGLSIVTRVPFSKNPLSSSRSLCSFSSSSLFIHLHDGSPFLPPPSLYKGMHTQRRRGAPFSSTCPLRAIPTAEAEEEEEKREREREGEQRVGGGHHPRIGDLENLQHPFLPSFQDSLHGRTVRRMVERGEGRVKGTPSRIYQTRADFFFFFSSFPRPANS